MSLEGKGWAGGRDGVGGVEEQKMNVTKDEKKCARGGVGGLMWLP